MHRINSTPTDPRLILKGLSREDRKFLGRRRLSEAFIADAKAAHLDTKSDSKDLTCFFRVFQNKNRKLLHLLAKIIENGDAEELKVSIEHLPPDLLNARLGRGETLLTHSAATNANKCVKVLVDAGANPCVENLSGLDAFDYGLLEKVYDARWKQAGFSALTFEILKSKGVTAFLLKRGINPLISKNRNSNILTLCIKKNDILALKYILANKNLQIRRVAKKARFDFDGSGESPLTLASKNRDPAYLRLIEKNSRLQEIFLPSSQQAGA